MIFTTVSIILALEIYIENYSPNYVKPHILKALSLLQAETELSNLWRNFFSDTH